jgi:O-antigen chain-terminating methyltransferase
MKETINTIKLRMNNQDHQMAMLLANFKSNANYSLPKHLIDGSSLEQDRLLDSFYLSFEDQFRGTREDIKNRLQIYLPYIKNLKNHHHDVSLLDLGCGRGEWLELLKDNGFNGRGVDTNRMMVKLCQELELDVRESDVVSYLSELKNNSIDVITGFHIIEHLLFKTMIYLIDEIYRILTPGGFVIFETPNPENIIVGSCSFYIDPTHINPIPLESLKHILESRGLDRVEILRLHPLVFIKENKEQELKKIITKFNCAQDYAAIGFKG